ncbi:MAG: TetR/AcrR family transcriptional regulator [Polyangiaceae bacterium]
MAGRPREFDRERALEQAMLLFWERGYDATSMSDLTEALGIGRQSLYGTFGDKRALFLACLERYVEGVLKVGVFDPLAADGSPLANVRRVLDGWEAYALSQDFRGCLLGKSLSELGQREPELDRIMRSKLDRMHESLERALKAAKKRGELSASADPRVLARALTAFSQGAGMVCQVWREPELVQQTLQGARALLAAFSTSEA